MDMLLTYIWYILAVCAGPLAYLLIDEHRTAAATEDKPIPHLPFIGVAGVIVMLGLMLVMGLALTDVIYLLMSKMGGMNFDFQSMQ